MNLKMSDKTQKIVVGSVAALSLALSGTALAVAAGGDDHDGGRGEHPGMRQDGGPRGGGQGYGPGGMMPGGPQGGQGQQGPGGQQGGSYGGQQGGDDQSAAMPWQSGAS